MSRYKSLLKNADFDTALQSHNCKGNKKHRILMGQRRLKVKEGRRISHYCLSCAEQILARDFNSLHGLIEQLG